MAKRIMAAMIALAMCAGLAACGDKKEDKGKKSKADTSSAVSGKDAETTAEDDGTDNKADVIKDTDTTAGEDDVFKTDDVTMKLIGNIIYIDENNLESEPTDEEIKKTINAMFKQYEAAENNDTQAFLDTFNLGILKDPIADLSEQMFQFSDGESDDEFMSYLDSTKQGTKYEVIDDVIDLLGRIGDEDINKQLETATEDKDGAKIKELVGKLIDGVTPDAAPVKENLDDTTIFNSKEDVEKLGEIGDDAIFGFYLEYCSRYNDEIYMRYTFSVLTDDKEYDLGGIESWGVNGEYGVYLQSEAYEMDLEDDMKGMDARQIFESLKLQMQAE
jgi:hypothetical protein